jgi:hypothetical protein
MKIDIFFRAASSLLLASVILTGSLKASNDPTQILAGVIEGSLSSLRKDPDFSSLATDGMRVKAVREILSLMLMSMAREPEVVSQTIQSAPVELDGNPASLAQEIIRKIGELAPSSSRDFHQAIRETASTFELWPSTNNTQSMRNLLGLAPRSLRAPNTPTSQPVSAGPVPVSGAGNSEPSPSQGFSLEDIAELVLKDVSGP